MPSARTDDQAAVAARPTAPSAPSRWARSLAESGSVGDPPGGPRGDVLKPGGVFTMYNSYRQDWLIDRSGAMLEGVDGKAPCIRDIVPAFEAATDDHPYPYLRNRSLPTLYVAITLMAILTAKVVFAQRLEATGDSTAAFAGAAGTGVAV